jgi:hypothetical protein
VKYIDTRLVAFCLFLLWIGSALFLFGEMKKAEQESKRATSKITIYSDPDYGCEYLTNNVAIYPRIVNGNHAGCIDFKEVR